MATGTFTDEYGNTGTARFRYQAMLSKNIIEYRNYDKKLMAALDISMQGLMGVYGTGDSIGVFRVGPSVRTQYRGWGQQISYYQVSATTLDESTLQRELFPLMQIKDNYPKYLLTLDDLFGTANYNGILKQNIIDWLLE